MTFGIHTHQSHSNENLIVVLLVKQMFFAILTVWITNRAVKTLFLVFEVIMKLLLLLYVLDYLELLMPRVSVIEFDHSYFKQYRFSLFSMCS